jgi:hypothetical protein
MNQQVNQGRRNRYWFQINIRYFLYVYFFYMLPDGNGL